MDLFIKSQGQGNPLILLHGWGFNGDIWDEIAVQYSSDIPDKKKRLFGGPSIITVYLSYNNNYKDCL
jgi:pimeloyl-ACP methyl ester carboxylesterase